MPYCKNCGNELPSGESVCPSCKTKVDSISFSDVVSSVKKETVELSQKTVQSIKSSNYTEKVQNSLRLLGSAKPMFFATLSMFVLNFILSHSDMATVSIIFSSRSESFLGLFKLFEEYAGKGGDSDIFIPVLTACNILIVASAVLTALPLLFGKEYNKKFLTLNYISSVLVSVVYIFLCAAYSSSDEVNAKPMAYIYILQTMACFAVTLSFSKKLKEEKAKKLGSGDEIPVLETSQEKENNE